ncbi:mPR alpha [Intoshia linei]|uniref:MPR alpha n=1 Tax=Intoshia linei TaxID=1819745 RepID=A0A177ASY9_9BILA|nr:mPR alpha [Intoshia linei]
MKPIPSIAPTSIDNFDDMQSNELKHRMSHVRSESNSSQISANYFTPAVEQAEELVNRVLRDSIVMVRRENLPIWLGDNDFLHFGHRPELKSFSSCFKTVFRIHSETGNIWTHMLGCMAFIGITIYVLTRPDIEFAFQEKAVFSAFFAGAILCLGFSFIFHTVFCHSEKVAKFFNKLDYCGIALLTMGSFVPWLYYTFYCTLAPKIIYSILIVILGICCIIVSMHDTFASSSYRPIRAGVFIGLGLSGIIPAVHYVITDGFWKLFNEASMGWLLLMAFLYIFGAVIYALRFPERMYPGKFDIWFQSHQIFHVFVIAAAFVHYHGTLKIAKIRLEGACGNL